MADIPTPRSYQQILGEMIAAFRTRYPINDLKVGSPLLSILEAAAQSDFRNTSDIFKFLASTNLDSAEGTALDRELADEGTSLRGAVASTGRVTISDTRFVKQATTIYFAKPPPVIGSAEIYVTNAGNWPTTGVLYIGRGTYNYEGPLTYTNIAATGSYYTITLDAGSHTKRFHNLGESVIRGQIAYGTRTIQAGTTVATADTAIRQVSFTTRYPYTLLDGEIEIPNVEVVCTQPGTIGNVVTGSVNTFQGAPFTGAAVTNPLPFTNGVDAESAEEARARIRLLRKSRAKGVKPAIEANLVGVIAADESKRISSVAVVDREDYPTTVYIDDGTGYEEKAAGMAYEILTASANGGEQYFQLSRGRPVAKAYIENSVSEPFNIADNSVLAVRVGGTLSVCDFVSSDFRSPTNAAAYEVVHAINADPTLLFSARLSSNSTKVTIYAREETNEDIEVVEPSGYVDANTQLRFPLGRVDTLALYKNDVLLSKDGKAASVESIPQSMWSPMADGDDLVVNVDGTGNQTYTINDVDFVNAGTTYNAVSANNSLAAWAAVLNYKIPGVTVSVLSDRLVMTSNLGGSSRGALAIDGGSLASNMFPLASVTARQRDYTLNRNRGQIKLVTPLAAGDKLTVGTPYGAAFLESDFIPTTVSITNGDMYFVVDGDTEYVTLPLLATTTFTESTQVIVNAPDNLVLSSNEDVFSSVLEGDWIFLTDSALGNPGAYRVSKKASNSIVWMAYGGGITNQGPVPLNEGGLAVVRTTSYPQKISLTTGTYTAENLASAMDALEGAHGEVVRTGHFRVVCDDLQTGDIMYVIGSAGVATIPLETGTLVSVGVPHNAYVISGNSENSVPEFVDLLGITGSTTILDVSPSPTAYHIKGNLVNGLRAVVYNDTQGGQGNSLGFSSSINNFTGGNRFTLNEAALHPWLVKDRIYMSRPYHIGPFDDLSVVVDGDINLKRFEIPMGRRLDTSLSTYTAAGMTVRDYDSQPLGVAFGDSFSFNDFALYMRPRVVTDEGTAYEMLWRWNEFGLGGEGTVLRFEYATAPGQTTSSYTVEYGLTVGTPNVLHVYLNSGGARFLGQTNSTMRIGRRGSGQQTDLSKTRLYTALNIRQVTVEADGDVVLLLSPPDDAANVNYNHGLQAGDVLFANFTAGPVGDQQFTVASVSSAGGGFTNQVTFNIGAPQVPSVTSPNVGSLYFDPTGTTLSWFGVFAEDVVNFDGVWNDPIYDRTLYLEQIVPGTNNQVIEVWVPTTGLGTSDTLVWSPNQIGTELNIYASGLAQTSEVDDTWPVTVTEQDGGIGSGYFPNSTKATWVLDEYPTPNIYTFKDGLNYVRATTPAAAPANYSITLKESIAVDLADYSQWVNEEVYLVPLTADNVRDYLNAPGVTSLGQNAFVGVVNTGNSIEISTNTEGRSGQVEVLGGLANNVVATINGNGMVMDDNVGSYVIVPKTEIPGFQALWDVEIANTLGELKPSNTPSYAYNEVLVNAAGSAFAFGMDVGDYEQFVGVRWQIEKQGNYMALVWEKLGTDPTASTVQEGDYIVLEAGPGETISAANQGVFQIVKLYEYALGSVFVVWIENPNGVEERITATTTYATRDSVMPGDKLIIADDNWEIENFGTYTIATVDYAGKRDFTIVETLPVPASFMGAAPGVSLRAGDGIKLTKKIAWIMPHTDPDFAVIGFDEKAHITKISEVNDARVTALGKLEFPSGIAQGKDGYSYNTGLIGEANKVLYGLETDPTTYPGVVAEGANVNLNGPVVRRILVSLSIRLRNGANRQATFDAIRSAITSFVNSLGVGVQVAISDIVATANMIGGVEAVSVSSPTYGTSSDRIAVQPYEKAMVLDPDLDITLTLVA